VLAMPQIQFTRERHCGRAVRALFTGAEGTQRDSSIALSVHPAVNGYLTLFRAGEGEKGREEKEGRPTSVTPLPVGSLRAASPMASRAVGKPLLLQFTISFLERLSFDKRRGRLLKSGFGCERTRSLYHGEKRGREGGK